MTVGILAAWALPAVAVAQCHVDEVAVLPLDVIDRHAVVEVLVNGTRLRMMLDTGAEFTMVTHDSVGIAGLWEDPWRHGRVNGLGGTSPIGVTHATVGLTGPGKPLTLAVGELWTRPGMSDLAGIVGTDVLSDYDIEIDFAQRRLTLSEAHQCAGDYVPWQGRWAMLPASVTPRRRVMVTTRVGQTDLGAMLDSGASMSILSSEAAAFAGLTDQQVAAGKPLVGVGIALREVGMRRITLPDTQIGDELLPDFDVAVPSMSIDNVDMLIGANYFLRHRVWVSFANQVVFVQRSQDQ